MFIKHESTNTNRNVIDGCEVVGGSLEKGANEGILVIIML